MSEHGQLYDQSYHITSNGPDSCITSMSRCVVDHVYLSGRR